MPCVEKSELGCLVCHLHGDELFVISVPLLNIWFAPQALQMGEKSLHLGHKWNSDCLKSLLPFWGVEMISPGIEVSVCVCVIWILAQAEVVFLSSPLAGDVPGSWSSAREVSGGSPGHFVLYNTKLCGAGVRL